MRNLFALLLVITVSFFQLSCAAQASDEIDPLLREMQLELEGSSGRPAGPGASTGSSLLDDLRGEIFEEFSPAKKPEPDKKNFGFLSNLASNLGGELSSSWLHYWQKAEDPGSEIENSPDLLDAWLTLTSHDSGSGWRFDIEAWLQAGNHEGQYIGVGNPFSIDESDKRRYLVLNKAYLTLSGGSLDFILGRDISKYGLSTLYSPVNRYGAADGNDPSNPREFGVWQAKTEYYLGQSTFSLTVYPVPERSKSPVKSSRWTTGPKQDFDFGDEFDDVEIDDLEEIVPDVRLEHVSLSGQVKTIYSGWDLFVLGYYGLSPLSVVRMEEKGLSTSFYKVTPLVANLGAGFSTTRGKFEYHGEVLYNHTPGRKDDDYINYVGGFTYTEDILAKHIGLDKVIATLEYAGEWLLCKQKREDYIASSEKLREGKNDFIARIEIEYNHDLSFEVGFHQKFTERGQFERYMLKYRLKPGLNLNLYFDRFSGASDSYYGRWERNNRMVTELTYSF